MIREQGSEISPQNVGTENAQRKYLTKVGVEVDFEAPDGDDEAVDAAASEASPFLTAIAEEGGLADDGSGE